MRGTARHGVWHAGSSDGAKGASPGPGSRRGPLQGEVGLPVAGGEEAGTAPVETALTSWKRSSARAAASAGLPPKMCATTGRPTTPTEHVKTKTRKHTGA